MILLPKYRGFADPQRPINMGKAGFSGEVRAILYDENMKPVYDSGWEPNLITNNGLNVIRVGPFYHEYRTVIGDDGTAAAFSDTSLYNKIAHSGTAGSGDGAQVIGSAPDWEYSEVSSRRFAAGNGTGTVREAGLSQNDGGTNLFNRVVLTTPIVKAADQALDILFRLTVWPPSVDVNGTSTIEGVSYDTITRGRVYPTGMGSGGLATVWEKLAAGTSYSNYAAYSGDIGLITDNPAGTNSQAENGEWGLVVPAYITDSHYMDVQVFSGLNGWVVSGNEFRSLTGTCQKFAWQTQFNATSGGGKIPKDNTEIMDFTWRVSWGRK